MIKDTTILIQGNINKFTYDFYVNNYKNIPILISTWEDNQISQLNGVDNLSIIKNKIPAISGKQNGYLQLISTLKGLNSIDTKYTIKVRGDETYSNLNYIYDLLSVDDSKLYTTPVFFRKWEYKLEYHISDHMVCGLTSNLHNMFNTALQNWESKNYEYRDTIEVLLGKSYIDYCENAILNFDVSNAEYMKKYFSILNLDNLKPYKITANVFKKEWNNDFIPENEYSISNINQII